MQISCRTLFDCSATGITGHFRPHQVPFRDQSNNHITDQATWNRARNQQRNWETIQQMIGLRAQATVIQIPENVNNKWRFVFEVDSPGVYSSTGVLGDLGLLLTECAGIPMCADQDETPGMQPQLITSGIDQNIWFETINTSMERY